MADVMVIAYFLYLVTLFLVMAGVCSNRVIIIDAMLIAKGINVRSLLLKGQIILFTRLFIFSFIFIAETLSELRENLKEVIEVLTRTEGSVTSISSGCELFLRFITLASLDNPVCRNCLSCMHIKLVIF